MATYHHYQDAPVGEGEPEYTVGTLVIEDRNSYDRIFKNVIVETVFFRNGFLSFETYGTDIIKNVASSDYIVFHFDYSEDI